MTKRAAEKPVKGKKVATARRQSNKDHGSGNPIQIRVEIDCLLQLINLLH